MSPSTTPASAAVRDAVEADLRRVGELAAALVRMHHAWDRHRFMLIEPVEQGYATFLRHELRRKEAVLMVAEIEGVIVGYAYGSIEPRDWNALLDAHGALHDVYVDPSARRRRVAAALVHAMTARLAKLGAPRVLLSSAWANPEGQAFFEAMGFRKTMVEMTRESEGA